MDEQAIKTTRRATEEMSKLAAAMSSHCLEVLEDQLEQYGVLLDGLSEEQVADLFASYDDESVWWHFFEAHAGAVYAFAGRQGLREATSPKPVA